MDLKEPLQSQPGPDANFADSTRRRQCFPRWHAMGEFILLFVAISPVFLIAAVAGSKNHWLSWLEKIGFREGWGQETRNSPPAATWQGDGVADFGKISVHMYDPLSGLIRDVNFRLRAVTGCSDREEFDSFIRRIGYAIRDEVLVTVRASTLSEVSDAELLGRKITTRINRVFAPETIRSVEIGDLTVSEGSPEPNQN
ncbi:MAG: hypothetical protein ACUVQG_00840 [Thermogutta sp.]